MDYVRFNPTDEFYKSIVGAVAEGVRFGIRLQINQIVDPSQVKLVVYGDDNVFKQEYVM